MIQPQGLTLEDEDGKHGEDGQCDYLLNNFELPKIKRPAIFIKANSVGWNLGCVFEKCNSPTDKNNGW